MIHLQNEILEVIISPLGAELQKLFNKRTQLDYLWNGDKQFWPRHSPVLFPIVGSLKQDSYYYEGNSYTLPRHGFARDQEFAAEQLSETEVLFTLKSDDASKAIYPFEFVLKLHYKLEGDRLFVDYTVENPVTDDLYFSIGAHPAFKLPLADGTVYEDYYLEFDKAITAGHYPIAAGGLLEQQSIPFLDNQATIQLSPGLFAQDAIVLRDTGVSTVAIKSNKTEHGLTFDLDGWPDLGLWAAPGAPFVCIEPWSGFADFPDHDQQLVHKAGIIKLKGNESWQKGWSVTLF